jgi:hypothetical protein
LTDWKQATIDTYNKSAKELAVYFRGIGSRVSDIEKAIKLVGNIDNPSVLEIGCGWFSIDEALSRVEDGLKPSLKMLMGETTFNEKYAQ